jgi:hypothetical protein
MIVVDQNSTMITFDAAIRPESESQFVLWQAELSAAITESSGFVSLEFLCSSPKEHRWVVVQRFCNAQSVADWKQSVRYKTLLADLIRLATTQGVRENLESETDLKSCVTEMIITHVPLEKEAEFRNWSAKIHGIEAKFEGFRGIYVKSPVQTNSRNWITLLQFDTPKNLDRWLNSDARKEILKESAAFAASFETHRVSSPYPGWFNSLSKTEAAPSAWKQTLIVILVLFPIVMLQMKYLSPLTQGFDRSLATFIACVISVSLITFPIMPLTVNLLGWWLHPEKSRYVRNTILGTLFVFLLFFVEVFLFWKFL